MNNIESWLKELDKVKKVTQPFGKHIASFRLSEHEIGIYTLLHVALVSASGAISKNQERLYEFYFPSISPKLKLSELLSLAQKFSAKELEKSVGILKEHNLTLHFLLDALIFMRLDGKVSSEVKSLLDGFCQSMQIPESDIKQVVYLSDKVFNIKESNKPELDESFDDLISNNTWVEFFSKKISENNISNISDGIWRLDEKIENIGDDIEWENCTIIFSEDGHVFQSNGTLNINNSTLIKPVFDLSSVEVNINNSTLKGFYQETSKVTVLSIYGCEIINISNVKFKTINARGIYINNHVSSCNISNSSFDMCGNRFMLGGAVNYISGVKFDNCKFTRCIAFVGAATFLEHLSLGSYKDCLIKACDSIVEWAENTNAGSIYASDEDNACNIVNSNIDNNITSYNLRSDGDGYAMLKNSNFRGEICYNHTNYSKVNPLDQNSKRLSGSQSKQFARQLKIKTKSELNEECEKIE
ncbi:hypothetical protein HGP28_18545 [Vibrio sp. SM6]|uniref:Uncharacterized protein n=1 Tax=Vibrio agarilyticus TaxID=2726741 RepID=A0A7X8TTY8_9VIBR|nr:hypothetical protein [Vibrio agarilyticus]NLS14862.1 hypothetical protein [Vibrio agarilyticus]